MRPNERNVYRFTICFSLDFLPEQVSEDEPGDATTGYSAAPSALEGASLPDRM